MALDPSARYPSQTDDTDAAYPRGKAQNKSGPDTEDGTPYEADLVNDLWGFQQALMDEAGVTPSGNPDEVGTSDYLDSLDVLYAREPRVANIESRIVSDEWTYPSDKTRTKFFTAVAGNANIASDSVGYSIVQFNNYPQVRLQADAPLRWIVDITEMVPEGATVTGLRALVQPGAARATTADRVGIQLQSAALETAFGADDSTPSVTQIGSTGRDDGTTNTQKISVGSVSEVVDKANAYFIYVLAGSNAGTNEDTLVGFELTFDDPGPRNF